MRRFPVALCAALALLVLLAPARPVGAGKGWCRSDPVVELDGQRLRVEGYGYANEGQVEASAYVFTVAPGSTLAVLDPGPDPDAATIAVVAGAGNGVAFAVTGDSPRLKLRLVVTPLGDGPVGASVDEAFARAVARDW